MDRYDNFKELSLDQVEERDFRIELREVHGSPIVLIAPHGGRIEPGTTELASQVASDDCSFYSLIGMRNAQNRDLHITSHRFDEPRCLDLLQRHDYVIAIHGCEGDGKVYLGGLDSELVRRLHEAFLEVALHSSTAGHQFPATHPQNICNRGRRGAGAQVELTRDLRRGVAVRRVAKVIRRVIESIAHI